MQREHVTTNDRSLPPSGCNRLRLSREKQDAECLNDEGVASWRERRVARRSPPLSARTRSTFRPVGPTAYNVVRLVAIRDGTAIMFSEFGEQPVSFGDAVLLGPSVLFGVEPEGRVTYTTVSIDTDMALDQFFWQYSVFLHDRLDAHDFAGKVYSKPAQALHLGRNHRTPTAGDTPTAAAASFEVAPVAIPFQNSRSTLRLVFGASRRDHRRAPRQLLQPSR